jgi:DNA-binding NtrC family response regulator
MTARARDVESVLVIDDQPRNAELLARRAPDLELLTVAPAGGDGDARRHARTWREAERVLARTKAGPSAVVLDVKFELPDEDLLPDFSPLGETPAGKRERRERREKQGLLILERLRRLAPDLPVVLTTAHEDIPFEEEARRLRADAFTYAVGEDEATGEGVLRLLRRVLSERSAPFVTGRFFWGKSAAMREIRRRVAGLAPTPLPLLVTGPTGSGKNLLAREVIHPASGRKGPFVGFDCATVPESLLASALFGSVRGAYTGSVADRPGVFEAAGGGTLFLDEIENLTPDAQKAFLGALTDGVVRRVGASQDVPHGARVVAATNTDLGARAAEGGFRADLLMRLNPALALELPPLAARSEDLPELSDVVTARFFAEPANAARIASESRAVGVAEAVCALARSDEEAEASPASVVFTLPRKAWTAMTRAPWPGNVRQFEMVLVDALAAALYAGGGAARDARGRARFAVDARLLFDLLAEASREPTGGGARLMVPVPKAESVEAFRRELERSVYRQLFRETKGDFAQMSERLTGSPREARAVRLRFNKLGLSVRRER